MHLDSFQLGALLSSAVMNILIRICVFQKLSRDCDVQAELETTDVIKTKQFISAGVAARCLLPLGLFSPMAGGTGWGAGGAERGVLAQSTQRSAGD